MGRYLTPSGAAAGGGSSSMRSQRHVLTASNPALPIPAWAKSMRISGCSGGAGGGLSPGGTGPATAGGTRGYSVRNEIVPIPSDASSLSVALGAGGIGRSDGVAGPGTQGGFTTITAGTKVWRIGPVLDGTAAALYDRNDTVVGEFGLIAGGSSCFGKGGLSASTSGGNGANAEGYGAGGGHGLGTQGGNGSPGLAIIEFLEAA